MDFGLVTVAHAALVPAARAMIDSARRAGFRGRVHAYAVGPTGNASPLGHDWTAFDAAVPDAALARRFAPLGLDRLARTVVPGALLDALRTEPAVAYLAPGVRVLAPLDDITALADTRLVLIERPRSEAPSDGLHPNEADLVQARRFSSAVIGAAAAANPVLEWWRDTAWAALLAGDELDTEAVLDRLAHRFGAVVPPHPSRFADWYSLGVDRPHDDGRTISVGGHALVTIDLGGYDLDHPHRVDARRPLPQRVSLHDLPSLADAFDTHPAPHDVELGARLADDLPFDRIMHAAYATALRDAIDGFARWPPNPYDDPAGFVEWLQQSQFPTTTRVSRYLRQVYLSRPDLSRAFPEVPGRDTARFFAWANDHGRDEIPVPDRFLPPRTVENRAPTTVRPRSTSVNLVGFLDAALGIGEVARRLGRAFDAAGIVHADLAFTSTPSGRADPFGAAVAPHDINVVCVNPDSLAAFAERAGPAFFSGRYTIGVWFWETAELPPSMAWAFDLVDEVWAASDFVAEAVRARAPSRVAVHVVTLPLLAPPVDPAFRFAELGLADGKPTFVSAWDYLSVVDRKNPLGTVAAYCEAFPSSGESQLLLKAAHGDRRPDDHQRILHATRTRDDIHVWTGYLEAERYAALLAAATGVVSLHRSEGLALNLADAIALGVPTIATAYGGNLMFMDEHDTDLVPYRLVDVGPGHHPYPSDAQWAEPDLARAAGHLLEIVRDPSRARARAHHAQQRVAERFGLDQAAASVTRRMASITQTTPSTPRRSLLRRPFSRAD